MLTARHMMLARAQREYEKMNFDGHYAIGVEWFQGRVAALVREAEKSLAESEERTHQHRRWQLEFNRFPQEVIDFYHLQAELDERTNAESNADRLAEIIASA
jgi:hypothetical protein